MLAVRPDWRYLLFSNRSLEPLEPALSAAKHVVSRVPGKRLLWMQCLLPPAIRRCRPELCHFPNAMAPLWQQQPFVLTIHDASLFLHAHFHPPARIMSIRLALPLLARRAAAVITVSQHARNDLIRILDLPPEKTHVVYEAAPDEFAPVTDVKRLELLRRKYGLPEQFLLYVGTLEPRKNLIRLVRALHAIRSRGSSQKLVLVGAPGWQIEQLHAEIERLSLQNDVLFTGYVPTEDLPGLYSLATLFVFPSLHEGFGLPPLEAMVCGAAVLASNRASLPEVCAGAAFFIDPEDEDSLVEGLLTLLRDSELRQELSRRGLVQAGNFSWDRAARETIAVYERALNGKAAMKDSP
jgi:glycosyltransferase involved in cell wall biosynthesis